jgi:hypothetical protein
MSVKLTAAQYRIVEQIKNLRCQGKPLNISAVRESRPRLLLEVYKIKPFWGWKQALEAAGIDYSKIKVRLPEYVVCRICDRKMKLLAKHVREVHGVPVKDYKAVYPNAEVSSPAYDARRRRARRLIIPHWEPNWTPEYLLDRIYELHQRGVPLAPTHMSACEKSTYRWAGLFFKNWDVALQAVGVDPKTVRKSSLAKHWTREAVINAIAARHVRGGEVNWQAMLQCDRSLTGAALKFFKSYDGMLRACGLNPDKIRKSPRPKRLYRTEDDVINGIHRRRLQEKPVYLYAVTHGPHRDLALWNKGRRLFGSWRLAIQAAGLDYDKLCPRTPKYKSANDILAEIRRRHDAGLPLTSLAIRKGASKDHQLYKRAYRHFKDWMAAVTAAGIDYNSLRTRRGRYPDRESVIAEIKRRHSLGRSLEYQGVRKGPVRDGALYDRALALFRDWSTALRSADVQDIEVRRPGGKYPTKRAVLAGIRRRCGEGLPLSSARVGEGQYADRALLGKALKYFTHWKTAIEQAGVTNYAALLKQRRKYSSTDAVIAEIRRRHAAGLPVLASRVQVGPHRDPALYDTARKEFGSWQKAIESAGLA